MKRLSIVSLILAFLLVSIGCTQHGELYEPVEDEAASHEETEIEDDDYVVVHNSTFEYEGELMVSVASDLLTFSSLEDFLHSYLAVKSGDTRGEFAGEIMSGRGIETLSDMADAIDLLLLERLYIPTGIPEEYKLFYIDICEHTVIMRFLPEEHLGSRESFLWATHGYQFSFTRRWNIENPMLPLMNQFGVAEADLIDGRFIFLEPNMFIWASGTEHLILYTPIGMSRGTPIDLVQFTEVFVLDMTDEGAILEFLENLGEDGDEPNEPPVDSGSLIITPGEASVARSGILFFTATSEDGQDWIGNVVWTVEGAHSGGTSMEFFWAPERMFVAADETSETLTVRAQLWNDPTIFGTATVTIVNVDYCAWCGGEMIESWEILPSKWF